MPEGWHRQHREMLGRKLPQLHARPQPGAQTAGGPVQSAGTVPRPASRRACGIRILRREIVIVFAGMNSSPGRTFDVCVQSLPACCPHGSEFLELAKTTVSAVSPSRRLSPWGRMLLSSPSHQGESPPTKVFFLWANWTRGDRLAGHRALLAFSPVGHSLSASFAVTPPTESPPCLGGTEASQQGAGSLQMPLKTSVALLDMNWSFCFALLHIL